MAISIALFWLQVGGGRSDNLPSSERTSFHNVSLGEMAPVCIAKFRKNLARHKLVGAVTASRCRPCGVNGYGAELGTSTNCPNFENTDRESVTTLDQPSEVSGAMDAGAITTSSIDCDNCLTVVREDEIDHGTCDDKALRGAAAAHEY